MSEPIDPREGISRRDFLRASATMLGVGALGRPSLGDEISPQPGITIGLFTDSHYADRDPLGSRHYRDAAAKLAEFVRTMNEVKPSFAISLGDLVDKGETWEAELGYLKHIEGIYRPFDGPRHYVIGNHDVATFSKEQFMEGVGMPASYYSFDHGPFHCIVLDANYNPDFSPYMAGNFDWTQTYIPPSEQQWLAEDLQGTEKKTLVFVHQPLDDEKGPHGVKNAPAVRQLLEASGRVIAVFQGHNHAGAYRRINGLPYFTLRALVEGPGLPNNAYALVHVSAEGTVKVQGFGKQVHLPPEDF
jgi:alkaline phosphatase